MSEYDPYRPLESYRLWMSYPVGDYPEEGAWAYRRICEVRLLHKTMMIQRGLAKYGRT